MKRDARSSELLDLESARYWNRFYKAEHPDIAEPSSFARYSAEYLKPSSMIFEIGCGNGRDSLFFARLGMAVHASDASTIAIEHLRKKFSRERWQDVPYWIARPMEELDDRHARDLDAVYMRFVLHAVPAEIASRGLAWAARNIKPEGLVLIEARSVLGSLYGRGIAAERDAFFQDGHYRRFIRRSELTDELVSLGFEIESVVERDGLAIHEDDDPVVIRVVARLKHPGTTAGVGGVNETSAAKA